MDDDICLVCGGKLFGLIYCPNCETMRGSKISPFLVYSDYKTEIDYDGLRDLTKDELIKIIEDLLIRED